ncbi:hypothetical protein ID866_4137 [Astraeus odoratus]|nr:hypothetical protein ID866_4137 [Astraeus odoratus]
MSRSEVLDQVPPTNDQDDSALNINRGIRGVNGYFPLNEPAIGTAYTDVDKFPLNKRLPVLFQPITIKDTWFKNRIWVSPMCQYSSNDGHATDWHLVHLGGFASRGVGCIIIEATAVVPEGRITSEDMVDFSKPLKRIVNFAHSQGTMIGIQLAHAGRKASTLAPWVYANATGTRRAGTHVASSKENGWSNVYGPSVTPYAENYPIPKEMTEEDIKYVEDARYANFWTVDFIEIHSAHGYLLHSFLSPLSNSRKDAYGGDLVGRMRFPLSLIKRVRDAWAIKPLFVRISASDWAEGPEQDENGQWRYWGIEQSKAYVGEMKRLGVDLVDTSSGGNWAHQKIPLKHGYQVPFAEALKQAHPNLLVGAVGLLTDPRETELYLRDGKTDVVMLARELLRDPNWVFTAARALGVAVKPANQYERAWTDMLAR